MSNAAHKPTGESARINAVKEAVRSRDGYCCTECGMSQTDHFKIYGKKLDVHRVVPSVEYTVGACVTVCRKCHGPKPRGKRHGHPTRTAYLPAELIRKVGVLAGLTHNGNRSKFVEDLITAYVERKHREYIDEEWVKVARRAGFYSEEARLNRNAGDCRP